DEGLAEAAADGAADAMVGAGVAGMTVTLGATDGAMLGAEGDGCRLIVGPGLSGVAGELHAVTSSSSANATAGVRGTCRSRRDAGPAGFHEGRGGWDTDSYLVDGNFA